MQRSQQWKGRGTRTLTGLVRVHSEVLECVRYLWPIRVVWARNYRWRHSYVNVARKQDTYTNDRINFKGRRLGFWGDHDVSSGNEFQGCTVRTGCSPVIILQGNEGRQCPAPHKSRSLGQSRSGCPRYVAAMYAIYVCNREEKKVEVWKKPTSFAIPHCNWHSWSCEGYAVASYPLHGSFLPKALCIWIILITPAWNLSNLQSKRTWNARNMHGIHTHDNGVKF